MIKDLFRVVEKTDFQEVEVVEGDMRIRIERNKVATVSTVLSPQIQPMSHAPAVSQESMLALDKVEAKPKTSGRVVTSPFVGTFYRAPSPDSDPYAEVGQTVKEGQILCIVEAMKLMNEIESDFSGVVKEILVDNGQPVEFGQELFRIE